MNEARIRHLISDGDEETGPTRSDLEDEFLRFIDRYDLPRPGVNQQVLGHGVTCSGAASASRSSSTAAPSTATPPSGTANATHTSSVRGSPFCASPGGD